MEKFLMMTGTAVANVGMVLAFPGALLIHVGDKIEERGFIRRSIRRQAEIERANPDFKRATRIE